MSSWEHREEMDDKVQYIAGISVRNPSDLTPKSWYAEMDAQAEAQRKWRFRQRIWQAFFYLCFFIGIVLILKSIFPAHHNA